MKKYFLAFFLALFIYFPAADGADPGLFSVGQQYTYNEICSVLDSNFVTSAALGGHSQYYPAFFSSETAWGFEMINQYQWRINSPPSFSAFGFQVNDAGTSYKYIDFSSFSAPLVAPSSIMDGYRRFYIVNFPSAPVPLDLSKVELFYPPYNNRIVSDFASYVNQWQNMNYNHLVLYFTRYYKDLDLLCSYFVSWVPDSKSSLNYLVGGSSSSGHFKYTYNDSAGTLKIDFNDSLLTNFGVTSIFDDDHNPFSYFTPTDNLSGPLLKSSAWNSYGSLYSDLSSASLFDSLLGLTNLNKKSLSYSDLKIPSSLVLHRVATPLYSAVAGGYFDAWTVSINDNDYYTYYVLMSLNADPSSVFSEGSVSFDKIFNDGLFTDNNDSSSVSLSFYNGMSIYGVNPVYVPPVNEDEAPLAVNKFNAPSALVNSSYSEESIIARNGVDSADIAEVYPSANEYNEYSVLDAFESILSKFQKLWESDISEYDKFFAILENNRSSFSLALNSFNDSSFIASATWVNNWLNWFYEETPVKIPVNIALVGAVIAAVIF